MSDSKLKPCPFCGSEASDLGYVTWRGNNLSEWDDGTPITEAFFCNCPACGIDNRGLFGWRTKEEAINQWNKRSGAPLEKQILILDVDEKSLVAMALNQKVGNKLANRLPEPTTLNFEPNIFWMVDTETDEHLEVEAIDLAIIGYEFFEILEFFQGFKAPNSIFVVPTDCGKYEKFDTLEAAQAFVDQQKESEGV